MTSPDAPDWDAARRAFDEQRWKIDPHWTTEEAARFLAWVLKAIRASIAHDPAVLAELRVALNVGGIGDRGWQQLVTWTGWGRSADGKTQWPSPFDEAPHVIENAIEGGLAWMLDELVYPRVSPSRQAGVNQSLPRFELRYPLHPKDVEVAIPRDLKTLGIQETTYRLTAYAVWACLLQAMVKADSHPRSSILAALPMLLSEHPYPPGLPQYLTARHSREIGAPSNVGRSPRTREKLASKTRRERRIALEVYVLWRDLRHQGSADPQGRAAERVAQDRGMDVPSVRKCFSRHRWLVELWRKLLEEDDADAAPSKADALLLAMYEDLA